MFILNLTVNFLGFGFFIYLTIRNNKTISNLYEQQLKVQHESNEIIKKTLLEKEILLAELHHRVKNNLAVIVGFLNLKMNGTLNEEARNILMESRNHVNSIALIHNRLYKTDNLSEVNFSTYIEDLLSEIQMSYPALAKTVHVSHTIDEIKLDLVRAVPCALILNELLTNCYKHAFKAKKAGSIQINFKVEYDGKMSLIVIDDGAGLMEDYDKKNSLGISIINGLSEQLNGECRFYNNNGTCFSLIF
jgi:two-component sensor histidine kinase